MSVSGGEGEGMVVKISCTLVQGCLYGIAQLFSHSYVKR